MNAIHTIMVLLILWGLLQDSWGEGVPEPQGKPHSVCAIANEKARAVLMVHRNVSHGSAVRPSPLPPNTPRYCTLCLLH